MVDSRSLYSRQNKGGLVPTGNTGDNKHIINSPITGLPIDWRTAEIPAEKVDSLTFKTMSNGRGSKLLKPSAVIDILPSIRSNKRNTFRIYAVKHADGRYEILSGTRRAYAVSITPGAVLTIYYAENLSEAEKEAIAALGDTYVRPSPVDQGLSILDLKKSLEEGEFSLRAAAKMFNISKTSVSDYMQFASLPTELFELYPSLSDLKPEFLRNILKLKLTNAEIISKISEIEPITLDIENLNGDTQFDFNEAVIKLNSAVLLALKGNKNPHSDEETSLNLKLMKGVKFKQSGKSYQLSIPKSIDESILKKVLAHLLIE